MTGELYIDNEVGEDVECNPRHFLFRTLALFLMCLVGFGSSFCYDNPGALEDSFITDMNLKTSDFVNLYSWYSWPNVIMCFVGGFLIDRVFGIRLGTIIYATLIVIGQLIFALGGLLNEFGIMIFGRFIFGIGSESLAVAQNNYAVLWFKEKDLNMVFGLQLSFARVGSTVNFIVMDMLYRWVNSYCEKFMCIGIVLVMASIMCVMSLICAILLALMDKRAEKILKRKKPRDEQLVRISDVRDFPLVFWMISLVCVTFYVTLFPFIAIGKVFFESKYKLLPHAANQVNGSIYIISAIISPFLGIVVDKVGRNVFWLFLSLLTSIFCHALLAFTYLNPYIPMFIWGFAYSMIACALWPMVSLVIPNYQLGTAYGIMQSVLNLGLAITSFLSGKIVETSGYLTLEILFLACLGVTLITVVSMWIVDSNTSGLLNMTPSEREIYERTRHEDERENLMNPG